MNTTNYIRIFRGDDSDALGYQTIVGTIKTDLDLTGCKAVFRFLGFYAEFDPIPEDKKLTIVIPAQASRGFPPGVGYASLKVLDPLGKIRTFTNRIPVIVDTMTPSCGCGEFEVSFSPFPELEPLKIFVGPNADDFDLYTGFLTKTIDRASAQKYGLSMLFDAMDAEKTAEGGCAASPAAVKAAYDAVIGVLADNYYTKAETDQQIDRVAAYYITYDAAGNPFPTYAALANATTVYSGGTVRVPTRNDYCVVLADETHQGAEYRYIYAVAEGATTGSWQAQFPVEGVMTVDQTVQKNSQNPVSGGGVWSAIWGTTTTAFSSLYDWVVSRLFEYRHKLDLNVYSRGNALVTFPDGFSITYMDDTYVAPSIGETIEFYGPITSTAVPQYNFWVPYEYKDSTDFDPQAQAVWCLFGDIGNSTPNSLMFRTGASYSIANWNTESPTITLSNGEESGGHPTMVRFLVATGDTLAKASQLAGKLDKSGGTVTGEFRVGALLDGSFQVVPESNEGEYIPPTMRFGDEAGVVGIIWRLVSGYVVMDVSDYLGVPHRIALPSASGTLALDTDLLTKLDSTSAAHEFSPDPSVSYPVGSHCTHRGKLYKCTTATTGGTWVAGSWTMDTMTDPDAVLDITAQNQLRVVAKDGTLLWAQGYDLASTSSATLACDATNNFTFADGATTQAFTLPTAPTGKVGDFGLDIDNSANTGAATMTLTGLDSTFSVVVPKGESLNDMLSIAAGELARFYITLSTFRVNNLPTWHIVKQVVENGGAQS